MATNIKEKKIYIIALLTVFIIGISAIVCNIHAHADGNNVENQNQENNSYTSTIRELFLDKNITCRIGTSCNIVTDDYFNGVDGKKSSTKNVFNIDETNIKEGKYYIKDTPILIKEVSDKDNDIENISVCNNNSNEFLKEYISKMGGTYGYNNPTNLASADWIGFTSAIPTFDKVDSKNINTFYCANIFQKNTLNVTWQLDKNDYYKYLNDDFKKAVLDKSISPETLFKEYGTHVFRSVKLGGRYSVKYAIAASPDVAINKYKRILDNNIQAIVEGKAPQSAEVYKSEDNLLTKFYAYSCGGKDVLTINVDSENNCTTLDSVDYNVANSDYNTWKQSVNSNPKLIGIIDDNSLVPIWELIDCIIDNDETVDKEAALKRKTSIVNAFIQYGYETQKEVCKDYGPLYCEISQQEVGTSDKNFGFDEKKLVSDELQSVHKGYHLGKLQLKNCQKYEEDDGTVKYQYNEKGFQIKYTILYDLKHLPNGYAANKSHRLIEETSSEGKLDDCNFNGNLGYGAYYIKVTYGNSTSEFVEAKTNFLQDKSEGTTIDLFDSRKVNAESKGGISNITIGIFYRTKTKIHLLSDEINWRIVSQINFK